MHEENAHLKQDIEFSFFMRALKRVTGFDMSLYKRNQMLRILNRLMRMAEAKDYRDYIRILRNDSQRLQQFKDSITINVTEFFRDKEIFDEFRVKFLPLLQNRFSTLKVWSIGCATGEEPYTMAILMEEAFGKKWEYIIYATDIDDDALEMARKGIYSEKRLKWVSSEVLLKYFQKEGEFYRICDHIKSKVNFSHHDIVRDRPLATDFSLVVCRNVVIYFTEEAKEIVYKNMCNALCSNGILFIGATENILNYKKFGLKKLGIYFYQKIS